MTTYCCQPCVAEKTPDGAVRYGQVPTFYLNSYVQGIVSVAHAEAIVKAICNPCNNLNITVVANVTEQKD